MSIQATQNSSSTLNPTKYGKIPKQIVEELLKELQFKSVKLNNLSELETISERNPDFSHIVTLPDGTIETNRNWAEIMLEYIKRDNTRLNISIFVNQNNVNRQIEVNMIPNILSA